MKLFSEKLPDLRALYVKQLRYLLSAEEQMIRGLPTMIASATDVQLKLALDSHLKETEVQADRLKEILNQIAGDAQPLNCRSMRALIDEAEEMIVDAAHDEVRDAGLIAAAQRIEHYEIASYGAARHFARVLGRLTDAATLNMTVQEEGHADHLLTSVAERVNPSAKMAA